MLKKLFIYFAIAALAPCYANAQLLIGVDILDSFNLPQALNVDLSDGSSTPLWAGSAGVWGMAYDGKDKIYASSGRELYEAPVGGGTPTLLGEMFIPSESIFFVPWGLACANGTLYGTRIGSILGPAVIGTIDPATQQVTTVLTYDENQYGFAGLAFNPDDGLFYASNNDPFTSEPRGLYSIDILGTGDINLIALFPAGRTDIDGLAIGNGIAYLVEEIAGDTIHPFDLNAGVYLPSVTSPFTASNGTSFSGAAFIPSGSAEFEESPDTFNTFRGILLSGDASSISDSNDTYVVHNPGFTINNTEPPVWLEFFGSFQSVPTAALS